MSIIVRVCPVCDSAFEVTHFAQKYCKSCRGSVAQSAYYSKEKGYRSIAELAKRNIIKKCQHCGTEFPMKRYVQKFCSPRCLVAHWKAEKNLDKWKVLNRDNFQCQYCGKNPTEHGVVLVLDHIKPKADGGKDELDNLVTACSKCNRSKSDRPLRHEAAFKKRLRKDAVITKKRLS